MRLLYPVWHVDLFLHIHLESKYGERTKCSMTMSPRSHGLRRVYRPDCHLQLAKGGARGSHRSLELQAFEQTLLRSPAIELIVCLSSYAPLRHTVVFPFGWHHPLGSPPTCILSPPASHGCVWATTSSSSSSKGVYFPGLDLCNFLCSYTSSDLNC